ncbi:MAG: hypothetical protein MJ060_04585 [Clostridia bacterium]|nr:hypothetical protein [Clostridia bacterium]
MAVKVPYYRLYLTEPIRKALGINYKIKKIYVFKVKHITYLSTNAIPNNCKMGILTAKIGKYNWFVDVPVTWLEYEPAEYVMLNSKVTILKLLKQKKENK